MQSVLYENSLGVFLFVTVVLGGGAAWKSGQAVAESWGSPWQLAIYVFLLTAALRFLHFALFHGTLLSFHFYLVDMIVVAVFAFLGHRSARARQMATRYGWLYRRNGPLGWRETAGVPSAR